MKTSKDKEIWESESKSKIWDPRSENQDPKSKSKYQKSWKNIQTIWKKIPKIMKTISKLFLKYARNFIWGLLRVIWRSFGVKWVEGVKITNVTFRHEEMIQIKCPRNLEKIFLSMKNEKKKKTLKLRFRGGNISIFDFEIFSKCSILFQIFRFWDYFSNISRIFRFLDFQIFFQQNRDFQISVCFWNFQIFTFLMLQKFQIL